MPESNTITKLKTKIAHLEKLLSDAKLENQAIRDSYQADQEADQKAFDKKIKAMFDIGYNKALEDVTVAQQSFVEEFGQPPVKKPKKPKKAKKG